MRRSDHYFEIFLTSFLTASGAASTALLTIPAGQDRDWIAAGLTWVVSFTGSALAAFRALDKDPPREDTGSDTPGGDAGP